MCIQLLNISIYLEYLINTKSIRQICRVAAMLTFAGIEFSICMLLFSISIFRGVPEIRDGEDLWQWFRLEIRLNNFRRSIIPHHKNYSSSWSSSSSSSSSSKAKVLKDYLWSSDTFCHQILLRPSLRPSLQPWLNRQFSYAFFFSVYFLKIIYSYCCHNYHSFFT